MKFVYTPKETYSQADVDALLKQHNGFKDKGAVSEEDFNEMKSKFEESTKKLGEYTSKERTGKIESFAKEINAEQATKIAKHARISEDATDEEMKKALSDFNDEFYAKTPVTDTETVRFDTVKEQTSKSNGEPEDWQRFIKHK